VIIPHLMGEAWWVAERAGGENQHQPPYYSYLLAHCVQAPPWRSRSCMLFILGVVSMRTGGAQLMEHTPAG
jgi:hypothetical protein